MTNTRKNLKESDPDSLLAATKLFADPRVEEAKKLLLAAVAEHQGHIDTVKSAAPSLKISYGDLLNTFASYRGAPLWYPYIGSGIGNGALVELLDGSVKYDFISGIGPHYWGHSHPELIAASIDAAISNTIMQGHLQQNSDSITFSKLLLDISGFDHCFLTTSGVMANENALKLAFQKHAPADRVLAFEHCFAGRTIAFSQVTDKAAYREGLPSCISVDYIPFFNPQRPEESTEIAAAALKKLIKRYPKKYAAMIFELVQGEAGAYPGSHQFFAALMTVLKENEIAVIVDEVQTFGRTTEPFAFQHFQLHEFVDIVTIGKLSQVCATLFSKAYRPRPGLLSQTFTGSTSVIKAGETIIRGLLSNNFFGPRGRIFALHSYFAKKLKLLSEENPLMVSGPFGIGSMIAFTPLGGDHDKVLSFTRDLFDAGVIAFTAGSAPTRVRFLIPAGAISEKEIDEVLKIVEGTLRRACT